MAQKTTVLVFYGGRSTEHEISCRSAAYVLKNLDPERYDVRAIAIDKAGRWLPQDTKALIEATRDSVPIRVPGALSNEPSLPASHASAAALLPSLGGISERPAEVGETVVFPMLHGTYGEDGCMQGLLDMAGVAYVGPDTLASAISMDKLVSKQLVEAAGIPVVPYVALRRKQWRQHEEAILQDIESRFPWPIFVKPVSLGSSVGISRVYSTAELRRGIDEAFRYDEKVLVEQGFSVREIEFAALGDYDPMITVPGEVVAKDGFYSYEAKYINEDGAEVVIPADLPEDKVREGQELSRRIFQALQLFGMARIDLFLTKDTNKYYFNEVNTIPGFTSISQYPLLWQRSGLSPSALLDKLIGLALERYRDRQALERSR